MVSSGQGLMITNDFVKFFSVLTGCPRRIGIGYFSMLMRHPESVPPVERFCLMFFDGLGPVDVCP